MSNFIVRPDLHISLLHFGRPRLSRRELPAPAFLAGVRAVFLADVHLRPSVPDRWLEALLGQIAEARPDLLLLGGDYGESPRQQARFFEALGALPRPALGAWGVLGNNDRECFAEPGALRGVMARAGVRLLVNEWDRVPLGGGTLALGGLDEQKHGVPREGRLFTRRAPEDYRLLLTHYPLWPRIPVDLVLSGHTHGGQINLFGLNPFSLRFESDRYPIIKGWAERNGTGLLVSRGLGWSKLPLRLGACPELHLIEFRP